LEAQVAQASLLLLVWRLELLEPPILTISLEAQAAQASYYY